MVEHPTIINCEPCDLATFCFASTIHSLVNSSWLSHTLLCGFLATTSLSDFPETEYKVSPNANKM